jgi:hypothetical protein
MALIIAGLGGREVDAKVTPNQGIRQSARTALIAGLFAGLVFGLSAGLVFGLIYGLGPGVSMGLVSGRFFVMAVGLFMGLVSGLGYGGYACLSHGALRLVLWRTGALPLRTITFLDYATERIFLRRVGGGYFFVHRLQQEYFAGLEASSKR